MVDKTSGMLHQVPEDGERFGLKRDAPFSVPQALVCYIQTEGFKPPHSPLSLHYLVTLPLPAGIALLPVRVGENAAGMSISQELNGGSTSEIPSRASIPGTLMFRTALP